MRLSKKGACSLILATILVFSFVALMQRQKIEVLLAGASRTSGKSTHLLVLLHNSGAIPFEQYSLLTFPISSIITSRTAESVSFTNSTRTEIYAYIETNPGMHFRGVVNGLGLTIGLAEYHLGVLKRAGLVSFIRDGRYKRFFAFGKFSKKEITAISLMRHQAIRRIFQTLLERKRASHSEIARQLSMTSQALTWQMNYVKEAKLIQCETEGTKTLYSLDVHIVPTLTKCLSLVELKP
jgi:predicted transcriptional regulator